jgi:hypothetical protein
MTSLMRLELQRRYGLYFSILPPYSSVPVIGRSVKKLLEITIGGMYFYSIKSSFYGVYGCVFENLYRSFNIFNQSFLLA